MDAGGLATVNTRTTNFNSGADNAQSPYGKPVAPIPYKPTSVLNPPTSSGTGLAESDRQRAFYGQASPNGQSSSTAAQTTQLKYKNPNINI